MGVVEVDSTGLGWTGRTWESRIASRGLAALAERASRAAAGMRGLDNRMLDEDERGTRLGRVHVYVNV